MAPPSQSKKNSNPTLRKPFKGKTSNASMLEEDVPDFPRGGGSSLSREELDQVRAEVDAEFEAEDRLMKKRKKQNKMQTTSTQDDLGSLFGGAINGKLPRFANRITLKVKSKLEIVGSYADATEGLTTHGWIMKIEKHGCFVRFYNGVQGFAPRSELGLDPGCEISSMYHVEQVVKCRITSSNPASCRINLSFTTTPSRVLSNELVKPGNVVSGVVERVTPDAIVVDVTAQGHFKGTISPQHLADHNGQAELMKSSLRPGYEFDQLLVLDVEGSNLILSAKHSLVTSSQQLPLDVNQVHLNSVLHGYICNIIENGVFIRYLGCLTGFSPRNRATDDRRSSLSEVYQIGQSVRTNVVDVRSETSRITVSLKQSVCSSTDASFIQEYFLLEEKIAKLQSVDSGGSDLRWVEQFNLGSTVKGKVHEIKEFGGVVSFQKYDDVFGFISHYQLSGIPIETGSSIRTAVLDVSKIERLVDLSLKPAFVNKSKKETTNSQAQKKSRSW